MTPQEEGDWLRNFRDEKLAAGFSKEVVDTLLMLVEVVDWERKASPQGIPPAEQRIHELS